jgi:SAM-dependent methyltransferase
MSHVRHAVVWIAPVDEQDRANVLAAAHVAAGRLELAVIETIEGRENVHTALRIARRTGVLLIPTIEAVVPQFGGVVDLIESARRDGWRVIILDFGADSAAPSGTWLLDQFRALADASDTADAFPMPPASIRRRVAVGGERIFRASGLVHTQSFMSTWGAAFGDAGRATTILDWGSGSGRMTRHLLASAPSARITAADPDVEAIEWLGANLPVHQAIATGIEPPIPLPDNAFDLVIGHSVFSHLNSDAQDLWLAELARVTRPDGVVLVSVNGPTALRWHVEHPLVILPGAIAAALPTLGFFFWRGEGWEAEFDDGYHTAFHDHNYIHEHWGRWFDVVEIASAAVGGLQDIVVLCPKS